MISTNLPKFSPAEILYCTIEHHMITYTKLLIFKFSAYRMGKLVGRVDIIGKQS